MEISFQWSAVFALERDWPSESLAFFRRNVSNAAPLIFCARIARLDTPNTQPVN